MNSELQSGGFHIGRHWINGRCLLAPMAGLTDQPFRNLCREHGAALAIAEMTTADTGLWQTGKSRDRLRLGGDNGIRVLQIAGSEPWQMAEAARAATDLGADIVDINMGCPAKKVCNKLSGSALLRDEDRVTRILNAVTHATELPVTLKIRTGWNRDNRNGPRVAHIAEAAGIQSLSVHGRTRECMFRGEAEYDTIREIKAAVNIPVIANGDIDTAVKAWEVLNKTGADAVMIGRGALGRPWIFAEINRFLADSTEAIEFVRNDSNASTWVPKTLSLSTVRDIILLHLDALYDFYGEDRGVRLARKHLSWYCKYLENAAEFRAAVVRAETGISQLQLIKMFFNQFQDLEWAPSTANQTELFASGHQEKNSLTQKA